MPISVAMLKLSWKAWDFLSICLVLILNCQTLHADAVSDNAILFVTMVPSPRDFGTNAAVFSNHVATPEATYRGGDLYIRYADGTLKNLTSAAGFGTSGFQGSNSIAVREPAMHWDGQKAIFSMVVGAPAVRYQVNTYRWQLYEITGLGANQTPVITKVSNQPAEYNNFSATYAVDDTIIFASDKPRDSSVAHIYPQLDEYESAQTNTGLWRLNPNNGEIKLLDHAPSGDFNPIIDSFGRVIFTRWDHLQRDQQNVGVNFGAFNSQSEASTEPTNSAAEVFPEPRSVLDPDYVSTVNLHTINQFFPWMMNQDGTDLETLNHIGRQEVGLYTERSFNNDPNVEEFYGQYNTGQNSNDFTIFLHIKESPTEPGRYFGTNCQEFGTHAAGQIISVNAAPGVTANQMQVVNVTHPDTAATSNSPGVNHTGLYRDALPISNGKILASHTAETRQDTNNGSSTAPVSLYDFRLKTLNQSGAVHVPGTNLTSGISKSLSFWSPDQMITFNGNLWEVSPVEVKSRTRPGTPTIALPAIESAVLASAGVSLSDLQNYLKASNLALIVSRNLTVRDKNDRQQPTNLRIAGTNTASLPKSGKIYDIAHFQIFQGDLIRGYSNGSSGRRVITQTLHSVGAGINLTKDGAPSGAVEIAEDGSMAAFVPAGRALTWQTTATDGTPVVRERYWLTFQPGEVRVCTSCHGINTSDHLNQAEPTNSPLALARLLAHYKNLPPPASGTPTPAVPGSKTYQLGVKGMPKLAAGKKFKLTISGGSATDQLFISAKVKNTECSGTHPVKTGSTSRVVTAKLPKNQTSLTLMLKPSSSGDVLNSKKIKVPKTTSRKKAASTEKVCAAFIASLK